MRSQPWPLRLSSSVTLLDDAASHFAAKVGQRAWSDLRNRAPNFPAKFLNGSVCTGSDIFSICVTKVFSQLAEMADVASDVVVSFMCEKDPKKQAFLMAQDLVTENPDCCLYDDVTTLSAGSAVCVRHHGEGGKCAVKRCHSFGSGFSCTTISRYNPDPDSAADARGSLMSGGNATADTWQGSLDYMEMRRPWMAAFENVDALDDKPDGLSMEDSNLVQARKMLTAIGYISFVLEMRSLEFGVPQDRHRIYIGAVAMELYGFDLPKAISSAQTMSDTIKSLKLADHIPLTALMLPDDDELVLMELQNWQAIKASRDETHGKDTSWQSKHQDEYQKCGLRWGNLIPTKEMKNSAWFDILTEREKDLVVFTHFSAPDVTSIDVGQSIGRHRPQVRSDIAMTVTPSEKRWDMRSHRLRVAPESLALQGIPWEELDISFEASTLHSLAGNAWTGSVCTAFFMGMVVHAPIPAPSSASSASAARDASILIADEGEAIEVDYASDNGDDESDDGDNINETDA